jgi:medium-chain acyl-[acyl-carrier-protein] hydrolase
MHVTRTVLFGLPYAGGWAAGLYGKWAARLPRTIEVVPLELAGHGRRMGEPFDESLESAVADLLRRVREVARSQPYALFGHSMGGTLAYEIVKALEHGGLPSPKALFVSGCQPPHVRSRHTGLYLLSDENFLHEIRRLGGTPNELFDVPELARTFLPILRSDFRLIHRYRVREPVHVMNTELVLLHGDRDPLAGKPGILEWQRYTPRSLRMHEIAGDHFFVNKHTDAICRLVADTLEAA